MADWSQQFNSFLKTPLGQELIRCLKEDLHGSLIEDAEKATNQDEAYGLLKQAGGVILAVGHLQSKGVLPKNKGNK